MKKFILNLWNKLSDNNKTRIISLFNTFLSVFVLTLATSLVATNHIDWSISFWGGIGASAIREGVKAVIATFTPVRLGGKKAN